MRLIHELTLRGLLSFGPDTPPLDMHDLNVLIGPNGSGKSNLIAAIDLLRSSATNLSKPFRRQGSGGIGEWIWKGGKPRVAHLESVIQDPISEPYIRHSIQFGMPGGRLEMLDERIEADGSAVYLLKSPDGGPVLTTHDAVPWELHRPNISLDESILAQRKDPEQYPELGYLAYVYEGVRIYSEWPFGRSSMFRSPQPADMPSDRLEEDCSNLGLFLNHLRSVPVAKKAIIEHLSDLYEGLDDFDVRVKGGTVELFLTEGDFVIPAGRLSDGTLRYLCLLAILCDPEPPPLVCIEEPELGLHPDMLPKLADLMIAASERTQLVVTTHSDILVDAMTKQPESVVVFEKHDGKTEMRRLEAKELKVWLKDYRLGDLWTRGQIGGNRW